MEPFEVSLEGAQLHSNLSWLGKMVWEGKEIVILRKGKPYLKLIPHPDGEPPDEIPPRPIGLLKGLIWMAPDFDDNTEIIEAFEGKYANDDHLFEGFLIQPEPDEEPSINDSASSTGTDS